MKQIQSTTENVWVEIKKVELTQEEIELQRSTSETDREAKKVLMERIRIEKFGVVTEEDTILAKATYDSIKPKLKESDTYQLISANFTIDNGGVKGILNCRVNDTHIQVRI